MKLPGWRAAQLEPIALGSNHNVSGDSGAYMLGIFIAWPWLALVPVALFLTLHSASKRRLAAGAAVVWFLYAIYEFAMKRRWLGCSGECNIRVDLLLIYPVLLAISAAAAISAVRALVRRRHAAP